MLEHVKRFDTARPPQRQHLAWLIRLLSVPVLLRHRNRLRKISMEDLLIRERRQLALRREMVDCDYYRMLSGDMSAVNAYGGEYMVDYSWAELTSGRLHFQSQSLR